MQGQVLYFDPERGIGFISGTDGNRYHFDSSDLSNRRGLLKDERVEFLIAGNRAQNVVSLDARPEPTPGLTGSEAGSAAPASVPPVPARQDEPGTGSLFGYFRTCITLRYADFRGRARRREYWGFLLFFALTLMFFVAAGAVLDAALGNLDREEPIIMSIFGGLLMVAMVVPSLAVTMRRIHDVGLSGWFILLGAIPSIGTFIILVFALIPSQKHANKWGQVPPGVS